MCKFFAPYAIVEAAAKREVANRLWKQIHPGSRWGWFAPLGWFAAMPKNAAPVAPLGRQACSWLEPSSCSRVVEESGVSPSPKVAADDGIQRDRGRCSVGPIGSCLATR